jgi:hypothetical protein
MRRLDPDPHAHRAAFVVVSAAIRRATRSLVMTRRVLRRMAAAARLAAEHGAAGVGLLGIIIMRAGLRYSRSVERQAAIAKAFGDINNDACALQQQRAGIVRSIDRTLLFVRAFHTCAPDQFDIALWSEHGSFLHDLTQQTVAVWREAERAIRDFAATPEAMA